MSMSEFFNDLDPKIAGPLERITEALRAEISSQIESVRQDVQGLVGDRTTRRPGATADLDALEELKRAAAGIDSATEQAAILTGLLEGAGRFSSRAAFVLLRDDGQRCWDSLGFDARQRMQGATVEVPNGDSAWSRIGEGAGTCGLTGEECAVFCSQFEAPTPNMGALLPLSLGDHVAGYLYADRVGDEPLNITALQLLTFVAGQTLETLPVRKRSSTPALTVAETAPAAAAAEAPAVAEELPVEELPEEPAPTEAEAIEPEPELEAAPEVEAIEPEPEAAPELEAIEPEPEPVALETTPVEVVPEVVEEAEAEPLEEWEAAAVDEPAVVEEPAAEADFYEVEAPEAEAPAEEVAAAEAESVDEPMAPAEAPTAEMPLPVVEEPAVEPEAIETPAQPVAAPPTPAMDGSSAQVLPPDDVRGPGWAFTARETSEETGNEALHEEARRLARLLVTEIKLYNEEQVDQGRRSGDIYRRLQEDIDRSRQIFEDRIDEQIRADTDYFKDALIRILAGGDESLLGM